jgi:tRNA dimethylallyltransferase
MTPQTFRNALILAGPTASGKSALALELAGRLNAEIVAMDSMTLYRGMDVGTAKPSPDDRARALHHLLDVLDPWESASVAWWLGRAANCVRDIEARGRTALFVGGTALYLRALLHGLFDGPPADAELRARLEDEARREGQQALHARLAAVDPLTAARLHVNDLRRVVRALEVHELTGRPISAWQTQWRESEAAAPGGFDRCLCLDPPREELYRRIDRRVEQMVAEGLVEEVRALLRLDRPLSREARQALGYKELFAHLEGKSTLQDAVREIQTRSRNYAKRQRTAFRHLRGCRLVASSELTFTVWESRMTQRH